MKELTESTECNISDSHNDIIEELIQIDTNASVSVSNKGACKSVTSDQNQKVENQDENMTQIEVQIESGPQSLRKIECTHCKNYIYI